MNDWSVFMYRYFPDTDRTLADSSAPNCVVWCLCPSGRLSDALSVQQVCTWSVSTSYGYGVYAAFPVVNLGESASITVYDGTSMSSVLGVITNGQTGMSFISSTSAMTIVFNAGQGGYSEFNINTRMYTLGAQSSLSESLPATWCGRCRAGAGVPHLATISLSLFCGRVAPETTVSVVLHRLLFCRSNDEPELDVAFCHCVTISVVDAASAVQLRDDARVTRRHHYRQPMYDAIATARGR